MIELLNKLLSFILELGSSAWDLLVLVLGFVTDVLMLLHTDMPRLEGLLVGVLLAWLFTRRNKHPLLRSLSSPLKLIIDILDLVWDQCMDLIGDLWGVASSWTKKSFGWVWSKVTGVWSFAVGGLTSLRNKLRSKSE